ncbi:MULTISPECIES: TIGR04540 family protein [Clostridium]|uniref:TIGR04540 family protein n=1 Tax=Clostridium senegalense TaxID=1465809 RepID=A0A6M0H4V1_9CLOT|nr:MULTISPECIES: TIGR04540 family protein [Clostridium]NEU05103.1 TIGR04540 family protein [Clostridium senegalense]
MRKVYKNPKELATCLKDLVDSYLDDLMEYETLEEKVMILVEHNGERIYKDDKMSSKIHTVIETSRADIINKIVKDNKK